jgi:hypothetical protein
MTEPAAATRSPVVECEMPHPPQKIRSRALARRPRCNGVIDSHGWNAPGEEVAILIRTVVTTSLPGIDLASGWWVCWDGHQYPHPYPEPV